MCFYHFSPFLPACDCPIAYLRFPFCLCMPASRIHAFAPIIHSDLLQLKWAPARATGLVFLTEECGRQGPSPHHVGDGE